MYAIHEPMAAAIGIGLDVMEPTGNMIVDIGGGTTEVAVISLGGIVSNRSIKVAGDEFTNDIVDYMKTKHSIRIGEQTAETIKMEVGSALTELEEEPESCQVIGQDLASIFAKINFSKTTRNYGCLEKSIASRNGHWQCIDNTAPELCTDIYHNGVYLAGGGAQLKGLAKRLE